MNLKNVDRICLTLVVLSIVVSGYLLLAKGLEKRRALIVDRMRIERTSEDIGQVDINLGRLRTAIRADQEELRKLNRETFGNGKSANSSSASTHPRANGALPLFLSSPKKPLPKGSFREFRCR